MKAKVTDIIKKNGLTYVAFSFPYGDGIGIWHEKGNPERKSYDVELDFETKIQSDMIVRGTGLPSIKRIGDYTFVCVTVDSVDDDGMAYLRLHTSCLIMAESNLTSAHIDSRLAFKLNSDQLTITPFGF